MAPRKSASKLSKPAAKKPAAKKTAAKKTTKDAAPPGAYYEKLKSGHLKLKWKVDQKMPALMNRNMTLLEGARYARRPSAVAKKAEKRRSSDVLIADEYEGARSNWEAPDAMPDEWAAEDRGWVPGPIIRRHPPFKGPKPGPTNPALKHDSTEVQIMDELINEKFRQRCRLYTKAHARAYRASMPDWRTNTIECAFGRARNLPLFLMRQTAFDRVLNIWLAAKIRVAQLKPEVPAAALWGKCIVAKSLYDVQLDNVITFHQFNCG